jgi:peptidoglycan/xylan/chitin deacetylase (PgdA/CDA1 family)
VAAVLTAAAACLAPVAPAAVAHRGQPPAAPPRIRYASLRQDGRDLIWFVRLAERFTSFQALARRHQSVCLMLEWRHGGAPWGELCATYNRKGPVLRYANVHSGRAQRFRAVPGTLARPNLRTLRATFLPTSAHTSYRSTFRWQTQTMALPPTCVPLPHAQRRCMTRLPKHPRRLRMHIPIPVRCVAKGPEWVFHGPSRGRMIALTFDDGPWYDTPQFLSVLERKHVVATFFQIGDQISEYGGRNGSVEKRMLRDGDMIGDHTWSHPDVASGGSFARNQIRSAALAIKRATGGFYPCLFRAPYGDTSPALLNLARSMGFTTIQWDVDPRDWSLPGSQAIYQNVVDNAHPGVIVIQHDGGGPRYETLQALPREIDTLRARGYRFVTVAQLLGYRVIYK